MKLLTLLMFSVFFQLAAHAQIQQTLPSFENDLFQQNPCLNWGSSEPCPFERVCGVTRADLISGGWVTLSIAGGQQVDVMASTTAAQGFLSLLEVHGASICDPLANSRVVPFEICYYGNVHQSEMVEQTAPRFFCGESLQCQGVHCGGNGVTVNSGNG